MQRSPASRLAFRLFLLVNATLFLRPAELVPAVTGWPFYELFILSACGLTFVGMRRHLRVQALKQQPITLCVAGVLVAVVLSHLTHSYLHGTLASGIGFLKTLVYYTLLVAIVDTPLRLKTLARTVAACASFMVLLCVVDYVGWYDLEFIQHVSDRDGVADSGDDVVVLRMRGMGIFQDPNDISLVIVAAGVLCMFFFNERSAGAKRYLWLFPMIVLVAGLYFTRSRGGLLAAGSAGMAFLLMRFGRKVAIAGAGLALGMLPLLAGRQGNIDLEGGTGQERLRLWREGIAAIKSPDILFGIGEGFYTDVAGLVAHNSFVHAYVELGLFGGTLFFGCFFFAGLALYRLCRSPVKIRHAELARFCPYLAAVLVGWSTGLLSLSRCYVVPTYLVLGMTAAYINLVTASVQPRCNLIQWDRRHMLRLATSSAVFFLSICVFVSLFAR